MCITLNRYMVIDRMPMTLSTWHSDALIMCQPL